MTRQALEEAICHLEYLILNHFDPGRIEHYTEELNRYREELRVLEITEQCAVTRVAARGATGASD